MTCATLVDALRPSTGARDPAYDVAMTLAGAGLIALSAQLAVRLPLSPVPVTGQTFAVLLVGALLGSARGAAAAGVYLLAGAAGLPVFANGASGLLYMLGPTGGYLAGFLPAAWLTGLLAESGWDRRMPTTAAAMLLGTAVLFLPGVLYLAVLLGLDLRTAVQVGVLPFLPGEAWKPYRQHEKSGQRPPAVGPQSVGRWAAAPSASDLQAEGGRHQDAAALSSLCRARREGLTRNCRTAARSGRLRGPRRRTSDTCRR